MTTQPETLLTKHTIGTHVPADMPDAELGRIMDEIDDEIEASLQAVVDHIAEKFPSVRVSLNS